MCEEYQNDPFCKYFNDTYVFGRFKRYNMETGESVSFIGSDAEYSPTYSCYGNVLIYKEQKSDRDDYKMYYEDGVGKSILSDNVMLFTENRGFLYYYGEDDLTLMRFSVKDRTTEKVVDLPQNDEVNGGYLYVDGNTALFTMYEEDEPTTRVFYAINMETKEIKKLETVMCIV